MSAADRGPFGLTPDLPGPRNLMSGLETIGLAPSPVNDGVLSAAVCPMCDNRNATLRVKMVPPFEMYCVAGCALGMIVAEIRARVRGLPAYPQQLALDAFVAQVEKELQPEVIPLPVRSRPVMPRHAFHGPIGAAVLAIEPDTEADPVAILVQLLVAFGSVVGRGPRLEIGSHQHHANLFAVIVGKSSKARKGTSWRNAFALIAPADADWSRHRVKDGLSSGEGLIHAVRDATDEDPGEPDKRLLVVETELARPLKIARRKENTLSTVLRTAYDQGNISTLTRQPYGATDAHISVIAHITEEELRREMDQGEFFNGYANRIVWIHAERSKILALGGRRVADAAGAPMQRLASAVSWARSLGEVVVRMSPACAQRYTSCYGSLSAERPGALGAILGRAEEHVLRLALIYALADQLLVVEETHLEAALAVWSYAERSAEIIFARAASDPFVESVAAALDDAGESGLTRNELCNRSHRNGSRRRLDDALRFLQEVGRAYGLKEPRKGKGRRTERWFALEVAAGAPLGDKRYERNGKDERNEINEINGPDRLGEDADCGKNLVNLVNLVDDQPDAFTPVVTSDAPTRSADNPALDGNRERSGRARLETDL